MMNDAKGTGDSIVTALDAQAASPPGRDLFAFLDARGREVERYTYGRFVQRTHAIARRLKEDHRIAPGDRVALGYPPGLEIIAALFACARLGAIAVPTPTEGSRNAERAHHILADSGARILLTETEATNRAFPAGAESVPRVATGVWPTDAGAEVATGREPIAFLQYTSGSTSHPKGVVVTHANLLHNRALAVDHEQPVAVSWLPQHHDMGLIGYYIYPALSGGRSYGFAPTAFVQRPLMWLELITRYRATASSAPNFAFDLVLRASRAAPDCLAAIDLSSLRFLMAAAEPVRPDVYARFLRTFRERGLDPSAFYAAYGLAEATLAVTSYGRSALSVARGELSQGRVRVARTATDLADSARLMSCGRPLGDTRVEIVHRDTGLALPDGRVGDVWIAGGSLCAGYWGKPTESRQTFEAQLEGGDGRAFLRTGDLGFLREGELYLCGRTKDVINLRGQNIYPQDLEQTIAHATQPLRPGASAVFEIERHGEPAIAIVVETSRRSTVRAADVARSIREIHGIDPAEVLLTPTGSLPRTSSGKIMRFRARELLDQGLFNPIERYVRLPAPSAPASSQPFAAILGRYGLPRDSPATFAESGVDSLDMVVLLHELRELFVSHRADALAEDTDISVLLNARICDVTALADAAETNPQMSLATIQDVVRVQRVQARARCLRLMAQDAVLGSLQIPERCTLAFEPTRTVLLTGATGFLGPFLLNSLVRQTPARVVALVRAGSAEDAAARLHSALRRAGFDPAAIGDRVQVIMGDLEQPGLGLGAAQWERLAHHVDAIYHNGALVNYLFDYERMRAANVGGTREVLRLAADGRPKVVNHISTTFIFGWSARPVLFETDENPEMARLDFGYSQSKWVSERLVAKAGAQGLPVRIFRPALITPSVDGRGGAFDITMRLLTFMIRHGVGVTAGNQVSLTPVDVAAANIVAISSALETVGGTFHVTRDDYASLRMVTDLISERTGHRFELFDLPDFVPEVVRRCRRDDLLFPLLDFLVGSVDNIGSMEFKRYDNAVYRAARDRNSLALPDPSLEATVSGILTFLERNRLLDA
jgi:thioester reductase-like protein